MTGVLLTEMQFGAADRFGGMNAVISWQLHGTGEGLTTGGKYIDAGEGGTAKVHIVSASDTFVSAIRFNGTLISLDGLAPDLYYSNLLHITLDANGNLKTSIENYKIICH